MSATVAEHALAGPPQRWLLPSGVELHGVRQGTGHPLVFVHGVMGDWASWAPQWSVFSRHFDCVTYSRRYNHPNRNEMPSPDHSALVEADDLSALLHLLGMHQAHLVASSYGAFIALALAVRHPQQVASIVAVEPAMLCYAEFSEPGRRALAEFRSSTIEPGLAAFRSGDDARGARIMTQGIQRMSAEPDAHDPAMARRLLNARAMRMLALSSNEFPLLPPQALAALPCPVLLVSGEDTAPVHAEVFHNVCAAMPQAGQVRIPGAGHPVPRDQPARFNALAMSFLQALRSPVPSA